MKMIHFPLNRNPLVVSESPTVQKNATIQRSLIASLDSSTSTTSYSSSRDDSSHSWESSACVPIATKRKIFKSILKTKNAVDTGVKSSKKRSCLRFMSRNSIREVETFVEYSELWWSKEEIKECKRAQSDISHESKEVQAVATDYMRALLQGRKQVLQRANNTDLSKSVMSRENYKQLAMGRSYGFAGLELYVKSYSDLRSNARKVTTSCVQRYREMRANEEPELCESLSVYARSLTSADRSWAFIIGNADREAALADDRP